MSDDFDPMGNVDSGDSAEGVEVRNALRDSVAATDLSDFTDFDARDDITGEGEFEFSVEQRFLKEATRSTKLTVGGSKDAYTTAQCTVFKDRMRIRTFNLSAFTEVIVPLSGEAVNVEDGGEVTFIFDNVVLTRLADTIVGGVITFVLDAGKSLLEVHSGKTKLVLSTKERAAFVEYHSRLGRGVHVSAVNPQALKAALEFSTLFVKKDKVQLNYSLAEVRGGSVVGGSAASFGVYRSEGLEGFSLKVPFETLGILPKVLPRFNADNTHLFEFGDWYVLRDEALYFGWKKTSFAFPPVDRFFANPPDDFVLIPRSVFLNSLDRLSLVSANKELMVKLGVSGSGAEASLYLSTKDDAGRVSGDAMQVFRGAVDEGKGSAFEPWEFSIHLGQLCRSLNHFSTANVRVEVIRGAAGGAICLQDMGESYAASTVLAALRENGTAT